MAFKGMQQQGPDLVSLALNLMQMKRDREFEGRKLALEEFKAQQMAQQNALQAERDSIDFGLSIKERQAKLKEQGITLDNSQNEREYGLGSLIETANNPARTEADRYSSARAFDMAVRNQVDMGRDPTRVGANAGAGLALKGQALDEEEAKAIADMERADTLASRSDSRAEQIQIRAEKRLAELETEASEQGVWTPKQITDLGVANEKRLAFTADLSKEWARVSSIDTKEPTDVLELIQRWQKKVDEGAVVREGDITMLRSVGASGAENFLSSAKGWLDARKSFPPGFAENLKSSYEEMLSTDDQRAVEIDQEWKDYAERNGLTPAQRARAERWTRQVKRAKERLAKRTAGPSAPSPLGRRRPLSRAQAAAEGLPQ